MSMFYVPPRLVRVRIDSNPHQSIIATLSYEPFYAPRPGRGSIFYILKSIFIIYSGECCIIHSAFVEQSDYFSSSEVKAQLEQVVSFLLSSQFEHMANTKILDACAIRFIDITQLARERGKF